MIVSIDDKVKIIRESRDLSCSSKYGIGKTAANCILKRKDEFIDDSEQINRNSLPPPM